MSHRSGTLTYLYIFVLSLSRDYPPFSAVIITHLCTASTFFTLLSWLPTYFKDTFPDAKVTCPLHPSSSPNPSLQKTRQDKTKLEIPHWSSRLEWQRQQTLERVHTKWLKASQTPPASDRPV